MKFKTTKEHRAMEPDTDNIVGFIGDARKYLTLAPAFRRWNTTSAVHGKGKSLILKLFNKFKAARRKTDVFL